MDVRLADYPAAGASDPNSQKTAGIGGLAGIVAKREADGSLSAVDTVRTGDASDKTLLYKLQMEGSVSGTLPVPAAAGTERP